MQVDSKTQEQLMAELEMLRQRIAELEAFVQPDGLVAEASKIHESRLASILNIAGEAIISIDENHRIILFNKQAELIFGYPADEMIGQSIDELLPKRFRDVHQEHMVEFTQSDTPSRLMGERQEIFGLRRNGQEFPADASISKMEIDGQFVFTVIIRDITRRMQMEQELQKHQEQLESLVEDRTIKLNTSITEMKQLNERLQQEIIEREQIGEQLQTSYEYLDTILLNLPAGVAILEGPDFRYFRINRALAELNGLPVEAHLGKTLIEVLPDAEQRILPEMRQIMETGKPILGREFTISLPGDPDTPVHLIDYLFPIVGTDRKVGAVGSVVLNITERKQAEAALQKANDELAFLLDSSRSMTVSLELDDLLDLVLDLLDNVVEYYGASIWIREGDSLMIRAGRAPEGAESLVGIRVIAAAIPPVREMMVTRKAFIADDILKDRELIQAVARGLGRPLEQYRPTGTSWMVVPLVGRNQVIGVISLLHTEPGYYTYEMVEFLQSFANQAAIAIDNARLYQKVQQAAVLEERDRLARDLHDAVTQTLFSASVIAEAVPDVWEKDPVIGRRYLEQLPRMLRGTLAEMRTLLLELRPSALGDQTLGQLLELLAEAARAHTGGAVTLNVEGDRPLPEDVTIALHRIAQESLNNVTKHAEASEVNIRLICNPDRVVLQVADDGHGFDPETIPTGHLGVGIMRERAQEIGAAFQIESDPDDGTIVIATWSDQA